MLKRGLIIFAVLSMTLSLAGVAYSQNLPPTANQLQSPNQGQGRPRPQSGPNFRGGRVNRLLQRIMRGTIFVKGRDGKTQKLRVDRGRVTAISDKSLTIEEMDGHKVKIGINKKTKFAGKPQDQLQKGEPVGVFRQKKSGHYQTLVVMSRRGRAQRNPNQSRNKQPPVDQNSSVPPSDDDLLDI